MRIEREVNKVRRFEAQCGESGESQPVSRYDLIDHINIYFSRGGGLGSNLTKRYVPVRLGWRRLLRTPSYVFTRLILWKKVQKYR